MEIQFNKLTEHTGTEVKNIDLREAISESLRIKLYREFIRRSILVVRGQKLSPHQLLVAAKIFGEPFLQHNTRFQIKSCPEIHYISSQDKFPDGRRYIPGAGYHTDHSNAAIPPKATILHAVQLPNKGGDTQFVNMGLEYETLDETTRHKIANLKAEHVYQSNHSERKLIELAVKRKKEVEKSVIHPIVRIHGETGRKAIYINPIRIERVFGMDNFEGITLLQSLLSHSIKACHEYRHKWKTGDFVIWDNRNLMHKANGDYDKTQQRYLYRLMLVGEKPE